MYLLSQYTNGSNISVERDVLIVCLILNRFNQTNGLAAGTPTNRHKSVRNRCVLKVLVAFFVLSRRFLEFSVSVGDFTIGLSQISSFFSYVNRQTLSSFALVNKSLDNAGLKQNEQRKTMSGQPKHANWTE